MDIFSSPLGPEQLWFHNLTTADGRAVAYDPLSRVFVTAVPHCANRTLIGCNWTAPEAGALCRSCTLTALAPDRSMANAIPNWARTEAAKRWVLDNLGRWGWFRPEDPGTRPVFHMLAEGPTPVSMGHIEGVVTISVAEADEVIRISRRQALDEPHRSLIGHMRHEIAHMLWWRLSLSNEFLDAFRALFGDERSDYPTALQRHYRDGPPPDWRDRHVTAYASAHPHEDWAETAANLLHLTDIADSFVATGLRSPDLPDPDWDAYAEPDPDRLIHVAVSLALGLNHVNRAMGLSDLYPFVLSQDARRKLQFVHQCLYQGASGH
ncbi:MAG: putative zinc-binding metallopeptidase [Wenzhouxiangella sp.]